jgi:hypothetical protein
MVCCPIAEGADFQAFVREFHRNRSNRNDLETVTSVV